MNVAETWQPPDWFASPASAEFEQQFAQGPGPGAAELRVVLIDGSDAQECQLLDAARATGITCAREHGAAATAGVTTLAPIAALLFDAGADLGGAARCLRALRTNPRLAAL